MRGRRESPRGRDRQTRLMDHTLLAVLTLIAVALIFDYINGFHDAANSIATVVSTRVLSPGKAVVWAAFFNFVAAFGFGTAVAQTVGAGMVDLKVVTLDRDLRRPHWGDRLGPRDVVLRASNQFIACTVRWICRRGGRQGWFHRDYPERLDAHDHLHRPRPTDRPRRRPRADDAQPVGPAASDAATRRWVLPQDAARLGGGLQPDARRQRCAEDDGHHRRSARSQGDFSTGGQTEHSPFPTGSSCWPTGQSPWARCPAAGASSRRWARRSRSCNRSAGSRPRPARRSRSTRRQHLASASAPRTRSPAPSSASASSKRLSAVRWGVARQIMWAWVLTIPASAFIGGLTYEIFRVLFQAP